MILGMYGGHMGMRCGTWMHGGMHHFLMLLLLVGLVALGCCAWKRLCRPRYSEAMQILRIRLASSEITPDEYDRLKQKLEG